MPELSWRRWRAERGRDERGAVVIIFTLLLAGGVLLGCVALTVDFGHFSSNHSQLQNAADAAAISAAQQCAKGSCPTSLALASISQQNDNGTAKSSASTIASICGQSTDPTFPWGPCGGNATASLTQCPQYLTVPTNYVQVVTTRTSDFTFTKNGHGSSSSGQACAAAEWAPPSSVTGVLPLTIPQCDFTAVVGSPPDLTSTADVAIAIDAQHSTCDPAPSGGKGWLATNTATTCPPPAPTSCPCVIAQVNRSNPGAGHASDYADCLAALIGHVTYLPVYDTSSGGGAGGMYNIAGIVGFYLDGIEAPSLHPKNQGNTGSPKCPTSDVNISDPHPSPPGNMCIWGYFTTGVVPVGTPDPNGTPTGLSVITQIG